MLLDVSIISPSEVVFEGKAKGLILPGEQGVFEVLPFCRRVLSILVSGKIVIDDKELPIRRGIVKAELNRVTAIIEQ